MTARDQRATSDRDELCRAVELLSQFVDAGPCSFDHHGDCQTHGFIGLSGCPCPNQVATEFVNAHLATHADADWRGGGGQ